MSWEHRLVRHHSDTDEPDYLMIHEVYDDGGMTREGVRVGGQTAYDVRWVLEAMLRALDKPALDYGEEKK